MYDREMVMEANHEQICLMFSPETMEMAWQEYDRYSNNGAAWNAYRNRLCLETFVSWLREFEVDSQLQQPKAWPNEASLPSFWEIVEGAAIQWGETRLVLMPIEAEKEAEKLETFSVPQDWVDIWPADYYVAIQVSLDEFEEDNWMQVWGYTTHRELKRKGQYNKEDGAYCLDGKELISDITMMLFARQLVSNRKAGVQPVPALDRGIAVGLLERLSKPDVYYPRLAVPFEEWGGLMVNPAWRQQLYNWRMTEVAEVPAVASWRERLEKIFDETWQTVAEVIDIIGTPEPSLAFAGGWREKADRIFRDDELLTEKTIMELIDILSSSKDKLRRLEVIELLGRKAKGNQDAIACLQDLLNSSDDEDLRREAAVSLGEIDPGNGQAGIKRVKMIDLGPQHKVALALTLTPGSNPDNMQIYLLVNSVGSKFLPPDMEMSVLDENGDPFDKIKSRTEDDAMQLTLAGEEDDSFTVKLALGDACFTEEFVIDMIQSTGNRHE